jgi:hypothetical protein
MAFSAYSLTPSANLSINGINIAEGCPAANANDAIRQLMSDGRALSDTVNAINVSGYMPLSGGAFTGSITRSGAGGYWYHAGATQSTAPVYTQPSATALPSSPAEGTVVLQY